MKKSLVSVILVASMMLSIGGCGLKKKKDIGGKLESRSGV